MRDAHPRERAVGMAWYVSDADGIGGQLKAAPEDFRVRERERFDTQPVDADPGDYPHLVLRVTLHGWDTTQFAGELAGGMGASRERVDWAGTKDKEAVTTQLFSVRDADPADLPEVDGAEITVVGRAGRSLQFGDLLGNEFEVVVRDPDHPERVDDVTADLAAFAGVEAEPAGQDDPAVAVPNYFGQQRFGSRRPVTHEVGLALARDDWKGAVLAYVGNPNEAEPEGTREARAFVEETENWSAALERFPRRLGYERAMLHRLEENGGESAADFRDALEAVPTNLQRLFVHAAQSYVFNRILSERLERGLPFDRPVAGDVACFADTDADTAVALPDTDRLQDVSESRVRSITRHCERGRAFVTAPLVGTETDLASGDPGDVERAVLDDLDLQPEDFDLPGEFHSTGTRRAISVRTDLSVERDPLTVSFALPKGSYATVLLREYLKVDPMAMS